jgi:hypothetical protein
MEFNFCSSDSVSQVRDCRERKEGQSRIQCAAWICGIEIANLQFEVRSLNA